MLGAVRRPGLVSLPDGSRVQDAIEKAGGLTRSADPGDLNLAQLLTDGEQIVIGTKGNRRARSATAAGTAGASTGGARILGEPRPEPGDPGPARGTARRRAGDRRQDHRLA